MKHNGIIAAIVIFAIVIVGMFVFAYLKKSEIAEAPATTQDTQAPAAPTPYDSLTRVDAKHYYSDGVHTLVGEMLMPTPCDLLNWATEVRESMPEGVSVQFSIINNAATCPQVVTPQRFYVQVTASEGAVFTASLLGRPLELNLIPAAPGETPEDFELYIKG